MAQRKPLNDTARVAKNSIVQLLAGTLSKFLGVLLVIYAARQLGVEGFGVYSYMLSLLGIFYIFTDFGLGTITTRNLSTAPEEEEKYLGALLGMRLILSAAAALGLVGTVALLGQPWPILRLASIIALSLFFSSGVDTCSAVYYAHQRMEIPAGIAVVASILRVGVSLGALAAGEGVATLLWIFTAASAVQFVLLFASLWTQVRPRIRVDWAFWRELLGQAYPLALANLFSVIYFRIDTVLLASLVGVRAVGMYNAAYRLLEFTLILPAYYAGAVFPVISASQTANPQRFMLIYRRSWKYMLVASLPLALGTSALAPGFIDVLYGPGYADSVQVLAILMWSLVLIAVNSINAPYLIALGRQRTVTVLMGLGMAVNVGMNLYAIPRYGIVGAAWVTLLSEVLTLLLFTGALQKPLLLRLRMLRHGLRPLVAGAAMVLGLKFVPHWDLVFQVTLGAVIYLGLLFALRSFDEVDWELFGRILRPTSSGSAKLT